ncbi:MAG: hypothetical protein GY884_24015 [Proteobacteria bacterium]|nr:hypothetical protein [Pseudomonadota bacterium]
MAHIQFDLALPEYLTLEREAGYLGITRLRVRLAQRGYGLVCRGRNPRRLHEAISLGRIASLKSVGDRTVFQVQALYIDGELRFAASSVQNPPALKAALIELVDQLGDAVLGAWERAADQTGLSLGPVFEGSPSLCGPGVIVERDTFTRICVALPDVGDVHLAHIDRVVGSRPIADPVLALMLGSKGRARRRASGGRGAAGGPARGAPRPARQPALGARADRHHPGFGGGRARGDHPELSARGGSAGRDLQMISR